MCPHGSTEQTVQFGGYSSQSLQTPYDQPVHEGLLYCRTGYRRGLLQQPEQIPTTGQLDGCTYDCSTVAVLYNGLCCCIVVPDNAL